MPNINWTPQMIWAVMAWYRQGYIAEDIVYAIYTNWGIDVARGTVRSAIARFAQQGY